MLIDAEGNPRLSDFGISSITRNIYSVNASTPYYGCTRRYCAPENLPVKSVVGLKMEVTNKSDVYSLSMVIVEARLFPEVWSVQVLIIFVSSLRLESCPSTNRDFRKKS